MRKIIAISFLFVFTALQYGKVLSYLYCELRVELAAKSSLKCDCEKIISENNQTIPPASAQHTHTLKEKLNEPYISAIEKSAACLSKINTSCFINQASTLQNGFDNTPFHPPATLS